MATRLRFTELERPTRQGVVGALVLVASFVGHDRFSEDAQDAGLDLFDDFVVVAIASRRAAEKIEFE